jgi:hypothetical protein
MVGVSGCHPATTPSGRTARGKGTDRHGPERGPASTVADPERGAIPADRGFKGDAAVQSSAAAKTAVAAIAAPSVNFEGIAGTDNIPILGGIPIPPDPDGDVGPNHYVEMVNTAWAVYSKTGTRLLGPLSLASIWAGFEVPDCSVLVPPGDQPWITGDGWLPADWDGNRKPPAGSPNYIAGT